MPVGLVSTYFWECSVSSLPLLWCHNDWCLWNHTHIYTLCINFWLMVMLPTWKTNILLLLRLFLARTEQTVWTWEGIGPGRGPSGERWVLRSDFADSGSMLMLIGLRRMIRTWVKVSLSWKRRKKEEKYDWQSVFKAEANVELESEYN